MPHGSLTPLGYRLRSVLVSLRPNARHALDNASINPPKTLQHRAPYTTDALTPEAKLRHAFPGLGTNLETHRPAQHAAAKPAIDVPEATEKDNAHQLPLRTISRRHENRRTKVDYLKEELRASGRGDIAPQRPHKKSSRNHFDHRSRHGKQLHAANAKRHASDDIPALEAAKSPTISRILASYVRHNEDGDPELLATQEPRADFDLSLNDSRFLAEMDYDVTDLEIWAAIVTELDSVKAAKIISARVASHGIRSVPLPVISYTLRRPYLAANALSILMRHVWGLLEYLADSSVGQVSPDTVFMVFNRLVRHARNVWPAALPFIAHQLVRFLPEARQDKRGDIGSSAQTLTFMLNKAMALITEPTAVAPFKDIHYQEQAVICVLSAMAEHDPPLQIEREGYRAVIRMQLAMGKTETEQGWAALKALSWPPWKEDRTSMDSEIGPEHGISRARATMYRMKEAGYSFQLWEQIAGLYTGWDVDGTPTIQTRVIMPMWNTHNQDHEGDDNECYQAALWTARIKTTRTVQEAWACYLAYEDAQLPPDQSVLVAILEKLNGEEVRRRKEEVRQRHLAQTDQGDPSEHSEPRSRLYPGDTREVEPLPPSTHLYTYTKTSPPTVLEFYTQLRVQDVDLHIRCLAYLISTTLSFRDGMIYLRAAATRYPAIDSLLKSDFKFDINSVPAVLFHAYIGFLSRYSNAMTTVTFAQGRAPSLEIPSVQLADTQFNFQHNLIQAIWLVKERKPRFLPTWNALLDALAFAQNYKTIHLTDGAANTTNARVKPDLDYNTIVAYRLTQKVLRLLHDQHMEPDIHAFLAFCRSTENVAIACWGIIQRDYQSQQDGKETANAADDSGTNLVTEANELLARQRPHGRIEQHFKLLVGEESFSGLDGPEFLQDVNDFMSANTASSAYIPRLLTTPEPAFLHAYIRALGWHGSHTRIIRTLKWMVKHQRELGDTADRARNGKDTMRRTIVAVRVFLERSWREARTNDSIQDYDFADENAFTEVGQEGKPSALRRLEAPAFAEQIEEARALVESVWAWGGWARDWEVTMYCRHGRFEENKRMKGSAYYE